MVWIEKYSPSLGVRSMLEGWLCSVAVMQGLQDQSCFNWSFEAVSCV